MTHRDRPMPEDLAAAIEDLRRIRETMDAAHAAHPMRVVARPWLGYFPVIGTIVVVFGVCGQLLLDHGGPLFGAEPATILWTLGIALILVFSAAKMAVMGRASRRAGLELVDVVIATFSTDYLRILVPAGLTLWLGATALGQVGGHALILGFVIAGVGAMLIPLASTLGLRELAPTGMLMFALGALALFLLPGSPLYTIAVAWGLPLALGGTFARWRLPAHPAEAA